MSNFAKGFNQGLSPYLGSIADLLSNVMIDSSKRNQNFSNAIALQNNKAKNKAQEKLLKNQQEQQNILANQRLFEDFKKDTVKNSHLISQMSPEYTAKAKTWLGWQPKIKYQETQTDKGLELQQFIENPITGERTYSKTVGVKPTVKETQTVIENGKTVKWDIMTDGTRQRKSTTIDKTKLDDTEQKKISGMRNAIYDAFKYKIRGQLSGDPVQQDINDAYYENKKALLKFNMKQSMNPQVLEVLQETDKYNDIGNVSKTLMETVREGAKDGSLTQKDISDIGLWYLLRTGKELE